MSKKFIALLRVGWAQMVEYRAEIVLWMMNSLFVVVMLLVWLSVAANNNGMVNGYTAPDFVTYFVVGFAVRNLTAVWASWELDFQIRDGSLSPKLLRPVAPVLYEIAYNLSEKAIRAIIVVPTAIIVFVVLPHTPLALSPLNAAAFLLSLAGAWLILFFADYCLGTLAFWTSQATAFVEAWFAVRIVLSGMVAPLAMFPAALQDVLRFSPFPYMLYFPIQIITGRVPAGDLAPGLAIQFAWAAIFIVLMRLLWRAAMRSYSAVGA